MGLAVAVALFLVSGAQATPVASGLHGIVTRGPIVPVCAAEQPCSAPAKNITLLFSRDGRVVAQSKTDLAGRYHLRLRPGYLRRGAHDHSPSRPWPRA